MGSISSVSSIVTLFAILQLLGTAMAASPAVLLDEAPSLKNWTGGTPETAITHSGSTAVKWVSKRNGAPLKTIAMPRDWTPYKYLSFWIHTDKETDASFGILACSSNGTNNYPYFAMPSVPLKFKGWKQFIIPFRSAFTWVTRNPAGWDKITALEFHSWGYGGAKPSGEQTFIIDDMELHESKPAASGGSARPKVLLGDEASFQSWNGLRPDADVVKETKASGKWMGCEKGDWATWSAPGESDFTGLKAISFNLHSAVNNGADYLIQIVTPGPNGEGDYFWVMSKVNWEGWKEVRIPMGAFSKSREGNLTKVTKINFVSKGWTVVPKADSVWHLENFQLVYPDGAAPGAVADFKRVELTDDRLLPFSENYRLKPERYLGRKAEPMWPPTLREPKPMTPADVLGPDGIVYPDFKYAGVQGGIPKVPTMVTLNDFGARENEDIYPALMKAIDATSKKGGGAILIKAGTYFLDSPVLITNSRIVIRGEGSNRTFVKYRAALKPKEFRLLMPVADGQPISLTRLHLIEGQADCLQMKEMRIMVNGNLIETVKMHKEVTGQFQVRTWGSVLKRKGIAAGAGEVVYQVDWRDGTSDEVKKAVVFTDDPPEVALTDNPTDMLFFKGVGTLGAGVTPNLIADGKRGDLSVEVSSSEGLAVGDMVQISAAPVPEFIERLRSANKGLPRLGGFLITKIEGNRVHLNQPLRIDFPVAHQSKLSKRWVNERCGVEDLTLDGSAPRGQIWHHGVGGVNLLNCWVKGVSIIKAGRNATQFNYAKFCEVRECNFTDAWFKDGGGTAYIFWDWSWDCLMENITGSKLRHAPNFQWTASGCVIRNGDFTDSDAQFHCGYAHENLMENCVIRSKKGNGSYGFGIYTQEPEADIHGPLGPRNVVWNCDVYAETPAIWCGGSTEAWIFAYNRLDTGSGPSIFAKAGCFDYTIRGNHMITRDEDFFGAIYLATPDCLGWWVEKNTFYGPIEALVTGTAPAAKLTGNQVVPGVENVPRPPLPVPSIYEWMKKRE